MKNFPQSLCFFELTLRTHRKEFWQPYRRNFANVSKDSRWKSEKDKFICPDSKTFTLPKKVPPDLWIAVLKTPTEGILHVTQKRWRNFFGETFFRRKIVLDIQNLALTTLPRKFCQWSEIFLIEVLEGQSELSFWNYFTFPQNGHSIRLVAVLAIQPVVLR